MVRNKLPLTTFVFEGTPTATPGVVVGRDGVKMLTKSGVTLIELVVGFVLLTGGSTILIHMMSIGMLADSGMEQSIIAMNLANERMEEIKNTAFASISSGSETGSSIGFSTFDSRVVTVTNTAADLKDVKVEVLWTQKGGQQAMAVETYVADYL